MQNLTSMFCTLPLAEMMEFLRSSFQRFSSVRSRNRCWFTTWNSPDSTLKIKFKKFWTTVFKDRHLGSYIGTVRRIRTLIRGYLRYICSRILRRISTFQGSSTLKNGVTPVKILQLASRAGGYVKKG